MSTASERAAPDNWHLWGDAYPLAVDQRERGIPAEWHKNAAWLRAARGPEIRLDAQTSA